MEEQTQVKCAEREQPTQNKPLFSRQMLIRLIIPLVIEQFLLMSVGMADTVMVTTAGEAAVCGVSREEVVRMVLEKRLQGIDRVVPFGETLSMELVWDGYNIIDQLSRRIG